MMRKSIMFMAALFGLLFMIQVSLKAQEISRCATSQYLQLQEQKYPGTIARMKELDLAAQKWLEEHPATTRNLYVIPVVVHVVYHTTNQNISEEKIQSQIDVLNEDFNRLNADSSNTPAPWKSVAGSIPITFCLAAYDPNGDPTTGIERISTSHVSFDLDDSVKHVEKGGADSWPTNHYLNIWTCNLSNSILGYTATAPGSDEDGVVITYNAMGRKPPLKDHYDLGRTCTHEVGHWLNLSHTFGDDGTSCSGTDQCNDTPNEAEAVYGCPGYPLLDACSPNSPGVMFMNYMDYTDDACMNLFTTCQCNKMDAFLNANRQGILNSPAGCQGIQFSLDASISTIVLPHDSLPTQSFEAQVQLSNRGSTDINYVKITYQVDGQTTASYEYNQTLVSLGSAVVTLPAYFTGEGGHIFYAWTSDPNHGTDEFIFNDTSSNEFSVNSTVNKNTLNIASDLSGNQSLVTVINPSAATMDVRLVNILGQVVMEGTWEVINNSTITLDMSHYANGLYFFYGKIGFDFVKKKIMLVRN